MGTWKLEVFKMGLYIAFPVSMFYIFNQPAFYEKYVTQKRHEIFPPANPKRLRELEEMNKQKQERELQKWLEQQKARDVQKE